MNVEGVTQVHEPALRRRRLPRAAILAGCLVFLFVLAVVPLSPYAFAQPQYVAATPGYVNLGMTTTIAVTAPGAGAYTVVVQKPTGVTVQVTDTFTAAGQTQTSVFGNATSGFESVVDKAGTYNVLLQQGGQTVASTSFYATNQITLGTDFITAGACVFVAGGSRGEELLLQIHATYASNGAPIAASAAAASSDKVTYTLPDGTSATASFHASSATTWPVPWFQGHVWGTWNSTWVGTYTPVVTASDSSGNTGTLKVSGYPFIYSPAQLNTNIQLTDTSGKLVGGLYSGQSLNVVADVQYLVTPATYSAVPGFNSPLSPARGGVANALVGWGFFNTTSNTFGSAKQPGGLIATVPLNYSSSQKIWTGQFSTGNLPALVNATTYEVVVSSHDNASPPNTGFATLNVPPATLSTTTSTTTAVSTFSTTSTATATTVSVAVSTYTQTVQGVPSWSYAVMALLLVVGLFVGYVLRRPK